MGFFLRPRMIKSDPSTPSTSDDCGRELVVMVVSRPDKSTLRAFQSELSCRQAIELKLSVIGSQNGKRTLGIFRVGNRNTGSLQRGTCLGIHDSAGDAKPASGL